MRGCLAWVAALGLVGCGPNLEESFEGPWRVLRGVVRANSSGNAKLKIKPLPGESALLLTAQPLDDFQDCHLRFVDVAGTRSLDAVEVVESPYARTNAAYIGHVITGNWPIDGNDLPLQPGRKHLFTLGVVDRSLRYQTGNLVVELLLKQDSDFSSGALGINIVYGQGIGSDPNVLAATEQAVEIWRSLYRNAGVELLVQYWDYDQARSLEPPGFGSASDYYAIAEQTPVGTVNIVIVDQILGFRDAFGVAGDIPGPLVASSRSGVVISSTMHAGTDGQFNSLDINLLAESMAHETGHFLGLFHTVELPDPNDPASGWDRWDALADTPDCTSEQECEATMANNLMFPYPVCDGDACQAQLAFTPEQTGVMNRYTGVVE